MPPYSRGSLGGRPGWLLVRNSRSLARNCSSVSTVVPVCGVRVSVMSAPRSDADEVGEPGPVTDRRTEQQLGGLGPFQVQVGVVLPGVADATVDLDVLLRGVGVGLGAEGTGQRGRDRKLGGVLGCGPGGRVGCRTGTLHVE